ncbi:hypothetical protein DPMN_047249 [Dreissena polymorpha]|uniref:Uncharacterized protein n=1 Tax=Dreissena polymorpha TaxID=45954 RepID=A0A9D4I1B3_DREPO|nr:hypothetical protein DPMN_047249 [Dreissena polymorpha]
MMTVAMAYRGDQTGRRGGGDVVDDDDDDADLDEAISVLTKVVGNIDQRKTSVRLNNKPEVTSSLTQLSNNQEIPANVDAIIDSALSNSKDAIPDSVADLIKSASNSPSVQTYNDGSNVKVNKVIKDALANAGGATKNTWQSSSFGQSVRVDSPSVQTYNDNKYPTPNSNGKSDNSNTDVAKHLQDDFGKIGNGQQSSWQNFSNVESSQNNDKPNGQGSSTSDRQTYTNTKKQNQSSYTRAPNYGTTPARLGTEITPVSVSYGDSYAKSELDRSAAGLTTPMSKRFWPMSTQDSRQDVRHTINAHGPLAWAPNVSLPIGLHAVFWFTGYNYDIQSD